MPTQKKATARVAPTLYALLLAVLLTACTTSPSTPTLTPQPSATLAPTLALTQTPPPTLPPTRSSPPAFGIDYTQPDKYRTQGAQTRLTDPTIVQPLRRATPSIAQLGEIYFWIKQGFSTWSAGGKTIGAVTVDQLLAERRLGGCHDWALVFTALARELGYPVVMVDTASINWAQDFLSGKKGPYTGHVFVEVFVGGRWVLVDPTNNWYVDQGYDPSNDIIPLKGNIAGSNAESLGFYVMSKGVDTWSYGIRSAAELNRRMEETAKTTRAMKIEVREYPAYNFQRFQPGPSAIPGATSTPTQSAAFTLTSSAFNDGELIPLKYVYALGEQCSGQNYSPPLSWSGAPTGVQSFAITVSDPNADNWVHWVQFNIPGGQSSLPEAVGGPDLGLKGSNDFGKLGYGGPCPPFGTHNYIFTLYALDTTLSLPQGATLAQLKAAMQGHILKQAQLTGKRK